MSLLNKLRAVQARERALRPVHGPDGGARTPLHASADVPGPRPLLRRVRLSNGLKEFLWQLDDIGRGNLLDLGPVCQATVGFFTERGFKVYTEDVLGPWSEFLRAEEKRLRSPSPDAEPLDPSAEARAQRFLRLNLNHAADSFDAVLLWDLLDFLDEETVTRFVARLSELVRDGGAILAIFHTDMPEEFHRYRVLDADNLELVPMSPLMRPQRIYKNREIQDLFERFRLSKTFIGRDQLREGVFVK
jgi:hypothetical protein